MTADHTDKISFETYKRLCRNLPQTFQLRKLIFPIKLKLIILFCVLKFLIPQLLGNKLNWYFPYSGKRYSIAAIYFITLL